MALQLEPSTALEQHVCTMAAKFSGIILASARAIVIVVHAAHTGAGRL